MSRCPGPASQGNPVAAAFRLLAAGTMLVAAMLPGGLAAADAEKPSALEQQLLQDLHTDPLDDLDRDLLAPKQDPKPPTSPPPDSSTPDKAGGDGKAEESLDPNRRGMGATDPSAGENDPLLEIARRMRTVEQLLAQPRRDSNAVGLQQDIVASLDELLEQARKQCQGACQGTKPQSQPSTSKPGAPKPSHQKPKPKPGKDTAKPSRDSNTTPGTSEPRRPDMEEMRDVLHKDVWGMLPERQRQQMLELPVEEFLPKYELLIEDYFRRLAEEPGQKPAP